MMTSPAGTAAIERRNPTSAAVPVITWLVGATVFFRDQLTSGFDKIMGNEGDARLIVLNHEHWFDVLPGGASGRGRAFFHRPTPGGAGAGERRSHDPVVSFPVTDVTRRGPHLRVRNR